MVDRALAAPGGDEQLRARAYQAGFMPFWMGDDERAAALFSEALATSRRLDDAPLVSLALGGLARVALRSDVPEGRRIAREALECRRPPATSRAARTRSTCSGSGRRSPATWTRRATG